MNKYMYYNNMLQDSITNDLYIYKRERVIEYNLYNELEAAQEALEVLKALEVSKAIEVSKALEVSKAIEVIKSLEASKAIEPKKH